MKNSKLFALLILFSSFAHSQDISGDWYGNLNVSGTVIPLIFHIDKNTSGYSSTMDSPEQQAFGIQVDKTTLENSILKMVLPSSGITYEGTLNHEKKTIDGTFKQGGLILPLALTQNKDEIAATEPPARPQEPKAPFPYQVEEVSFKNARDNISLSGTLSLPKSNGTFAAVILISGSGPQNRDSEVFGHKPFLVLSDHLTKNGIAVLRFDDRGVGKSEGIFETATSEDLATDVQAALEYLKSREEIDNNKIGLLGHSEGGMIAPMLAENSTEVGFLVLLAGPGLRGDKNLLLQKKQLELKSGIDELSVIQSQQIFQAAYDIVRESEEGNLQSELKTYFGKAFSGRLNENQLNLLVQQVTTPWMRYYLKYDPSLVLENIEIPVLALFGGNDFQVPPVENSEIIIESLKRAGNKDVKVLVMEDLNHLFQESSTGLPNEYAQIEQTMSPKVLEIISEWIADQN